MFPNISISVPIIVDTTLSVLIILICIRELLKPSSKANWPIPIMIWLFLRITYNVIFLIDYADSELYFSGSVYNWWSESIHLVARITIFTLVIQWSKIFENKVCLDNLFEKITNALENLLHRVSGMIRHVPKLH
jgi:hypothetical protein